MKLSIRVKYENYVFASRHMTKRALNSVKKFAFATAGIRWHRKLRPKHFTMEGFREYRYTYRKGQTAAKGSKRFRRSYSGRKYAKYRHMRPLVFTGDSEESSRFLKYRATAKRVVVRITAPNLNYRPKKGRIDMRDEMTRISDGDAREMLKVFDQAMAMKLKRFRGSVTKKVS